jgi:hypothetical protein
MELVFPFGFPWPTAMYLAFFVVTAALAMVFVQYVLAGSIVLLIGSVATLVREQPRDGPAPPARTGLVQKSIADWLPAVLSLAIAAAIAPFLFLQILYRSELGTASRILFARFLLMVPALVASYLLLYILKGESMAGRGAVARVLVAAALFGCLLFAAWVWSATHVLGLHKALWAYESRSGRWIYGDSEIWPRLGYWITASFPTLAVVLAWRFYWGRRRYAPPDLDHVAKRLKALALIGLATSEAEVLLWFLWLEEPVRGVVLGMLAMPYVVLVFLGMSIQAVLWVRVKNGANLEAGRLSLISAGAAMTIFGALVVREARRLAAVDVSSLTDLHNRAAQAGGLGLFVFALVLNSAIITACILIVRRSVRAIA